MARPKPKKGWDPVGSKDKEYFSVADLKDILRDAGVAVSDSVSEEGLKNIANDLEHATNMYDTFKIDQSRPRPFEIKAGLEKLKRTADALIGAMEDLDYDSKYYHLLLYADGEPIKNGPQFFDITLHNVRGFSHMAETAIGRLPEAKYGRRKEWATDSYLIRLGDIYYKITQRNPGLTGPFIRFAFSCLSHIGERPQSLDALKTRMKRAQ